MRRLLVLALAAATLVIPQRADAAAPAPVTNLAAFQLAGPVQLQWTTPAGTDGVTAAYAAGELSPSTPADGTAITLSDPQAHTATVRGLTPATVYSVAVWTKQGGTYSAPATTTFTTKPDPAASIGDDTITVTVVDTSGHPLTGADVDAYSPTTYADRVATTGSDGTATLHLPDGEYSVGASGGTGGNSDATGYTYRKVIRTITGDGHVTLRLQAGGAITGRVTNPAGRPLKGATVELYPPDPYVRADQGVSVGVSYVFGDVPRTNAAGRFIIKNQSRGGAVPCITLAGYVSRCANEAVAAGPGATRSIGTIVTSRVSPRAGILTGTVTGPDGRPLRKVDLEFEGRRDSSLAQVDSHGRYRIALSPGRWQVCADPYVVSALGYLRTCHKVTISSAATTHLDIRLPVGGAVSGRALAPTGAGAPHVRVEAEPASSQGPFASVSGGTSADADGFFTLGGLATGRYRLCIEGDDSASSGDPTGVARRCIVRDVQTGRDRLGADVSLQPGAAVTGTVRTAGGDPLADAGVTLEQPGDNGFGYAQTDSAGRYTITDLAVGHYRLCVDIEPTLYQYIERCRTGNTDATAASTKTVDFTFPALPTIDATVTDRAGHRLSGVEVAALRKCGGEFCDRQPLLGRKATVDAGDYTDARGRITLIGARPGKYAVCAFAYYAAAPANPARTGFADKCVGRRFTVTVTKNAPANVHLKLSRGGTITGRIVDAHGRPMAGVHVHLPGSPADDAARSNAVFDYPPSPYIDSVTDANGRYRIHSIRPGRGTLCGNRTCLARKVTIRRGAVTRAPTLVMRRGKAAHIAPARTPHAAAHRAAVRVTIRNGRVAQVLRRF
jgi:protocatechuate 3,4-dioxygenase beta subunit